LALYIYFKSVASRPGDQNTNDPTLLDAGISGTSKSGYIVGKVEAMITTPSPKPRPAVGD